MAGPILGLRMLLMLLLVALPIGVVIAETPSECLVARHCLPKKNSTNTYVSFAGVTSDPKAFGQSFTLKPTTTCHYLCNISCLWAGTLECPNFCYESLKRGTCTSKGCVCAEGWRGRDCSFPACPQNPCSNNGFCNVTTQSCECKTGSDYLCGSPLNSEPVLPWGELFPNETYWHGNDKYGDNHPLFNTSRVATVQLNMSVDELQQLLSPLNDWTNNYTRADLTFSDQFLDDVTITNIGVRNHGSFSRTYLNKGFTLDLHVFNNSNPKLYGVKKFAVRPTAYDETLSRGTLINDWYRLMGVPAARNSWCVLYLNDVHIGLMLLYEEFDDVFFDAHFGGGGEGNYYKAGGPGADLMWRSNSSSSYSDYKIDWPEKSPGTYVYQLAQGPGGNWSDFMGLVNVLHSNLTGEAFVSALNQTFDIDNFLRQLAVEQTAMRWDSYTYDNNNWGIYWNNKTSKFVFIPYDLEGSIGSEGNGPELKTGDFRDFGSYGHGSSHSVLTTRILKEPLLQPMYVEYTKMLLDRIWVADNGSQITTRLNAFHKTLAVQVSEDMEWPFDCERSYAGFTKDLEEVVLPWIKTRAETTLHQLAESNQTPRFASDNQIQIN